MKHHCLPILVITLFSTLLGGIIYYVSILETSLGLEALYKFRGNRQPPAEVVVAAMDEKSEYDLGLNWKDYTQWRKYHAKLLKELTRQGAALVIFDLQFVQPQPDVDPDFAAALKAAGNVLVSECVAKINFWTHEYSGREQCSQNNSLPPENPQVKPEAEYRIVMRKYAPTEIILDAVLDKAPFFLPEDSGNPAVNGGWTFAGKLDETPTLPVLAWFYYLERTGAFPLSGKIEAPYSQGLAAYRRGCKGAIESAAPHGQADLNTLIANLLCAEEDTRHLDFYGPPMTLPMVSYSDVVNGAAKGFKDKVVFVGKANRTYTSNNIIDGFYTPFSTNATGMMFGVEIMATQFANLLEGRELKPPCPPILILFAFALASGLLLGSSSGLSGIAASLVFGGIYGTAALWLFSRYAWWLPVAVPLLIQLPITWLISLLLSRRKLVKEKERIISFINQVFPQWVPRLPAEAGEWSTEKITGQLTESHEVSGICLCTDIEGYSTTASRLPPRQLGELLETYYHLAGQPVKINDGLIANVQGDAMMAFWIKNNFELQAQAACKAALGISEAVSNFSNTAKYPLPTRIGLCEGEFLLKSGDSGDFRYFNPFGKALNTVSRIEGVNKYLGTKILATKTIATHTHDIIYRQVGSFVLAGISEPLELVEIVAHESVAARAQSEFHKRFEAGLAAFRQGLWFETIVILKEILAAHDDGTSRFYLNLATAYQENAPLNWNGSVYLAQK